MDQSVGLNVWLGLALIAFTAAHLLLWRTRRVLCRAKQEALAQEVSIAPIAIRAPAVALVASAMAEPVASAVA